MNEPHRGLAPLSGSVALLVPTRSTLLPSTWSGSPHILRPSLLLRVRSPGPLLSSSCVGMHTLTNGTFLYMQYTAERLLCQILCPGYTDPVKGQIHSHPVRLGHSQITQSPRPEGPQAGVESSTWACSRGLSALVFSEDKNSLKRHRRFNQKFTY